MLYVGQLRPGGNGEDRVKALQHLGCEVTTFDTLALCLRYNRLERSLAKRFNLGRPVEGLNGSLREFAASCTYDIAWINKGTWLKPETVTTVRECAKRRYVLHLTIDSQFTDNRSHQFFRSIPLYDLLATTKRFEIDDYVSAGARDCLAIEQGYGRRIRDIGSIDFTERRDVFASDVTFVGHCQPAYVEPIRILAEQGFDVRVWGPNWPRFAARNAWARPVVRGDGLWGADYPMALRHAKISLCLLSKRIAETATTRTFEIPAARGFMLAERTPQHKTLFREGEEAVFFSDNDELLEMVSTYLPNETARQRIARAGEARCIASRYSDVDQLRKILERVTSTLTDRVPQLEMAGA